MHFKNAFKKVSFGIVYHVFHPTKASFIGQKDLVSLSSDERFVFSFGLDQADFLPSDAILDYFMLSCTILCYLVLSYPILCHLNLVSYDISSCLMLIHPNLITLFSLIRTSENQVKLNMFL